ncbi:MAG: tetratricopeptide repeat protein [Bacteroidetes bacterium]|nr:tetratricopeptide repeat protein [Bacteroidota bacterium]
MKKLVILSCMLFGFHISSTMGGNHPDKNVMKAFDLRMAGKVDEAKALLNDIIAKDSTNAMAYYELARLQHYMLVGGGQVGIGDIMNSIDKAVANDPSNATYAYYRGISCFLKAFISMQQGGSEVQKNIEATAAQFEKVLSLKPDYCEPMLYLVEIYGLLPREMGGDSLKAVGFADKLNELNPYFGARAKAVLMPENSDFEKFWNSFPGTKDKNPEYLTELGKACLYKGDVKSAEKYFTEAIKVDPSLNFRILDLARFHMMKVMQDKEKAKTELPFAKTFLEQYLASKPEPNIPLKAYTLGLLNRVEMIQGNKAEADKIEAKAKDLDKYFSRASGVPTLLLFDPPQQLSHHYFSFFSPY